ncbi:signal peptidase I [Desulfosoma caldarium]|uniref:Signal peptidase I n=1 Tax=Desulfosoma caldarium TaxID=610254 RepID=A0A3N1VM72_9BACT|nr:signal peptidase I [Desulfosoma caldarium]ROR03050.1 signal peptidase I [Desulfosoma caldarium]
MSAFSGPESAKARKKSTVREYTEAILIAVLLAFFIRAFIVQAFKIPSGSMMTTLLIGDHILVSKFRYGIKLPIVDRNLIDWDHPRRGDIIVFKYPQDPSKDFIKRVIAVPGDVILIKDKTVFINEKPLQEPYVRFTDTRILPASVSPRDNLGPLVVPEHSYFVMGDNRDESYDSRFWGFVDASVVKGKAFVIYWSWNKNGQFTLDPDRSFLRWNRLGHLVR